MITIKIKKVDGFEIVVGFGELAIDPEATRKANLDKILGLPESQMLRDKQKEKHRHILDGSKAKTDANMAMKNKNMPEYERLNRKYLNCSGAEGVCNDELIQFSKKVNEKARDILKLNPVYFETPGDCIVLSEKETASLISAHQSKTSTQQLLTDCSYIDDFRDCVFYSKKNNAWTDPLYITAIGVSPPKTAIEYNKLTAEQKEEIRLQAMSSENLALEYEGKRLALLKAASEKKVTLEIEGSTSTSALAFSKDLYQKELKQLKSIYKIV